MIDLDRAQGHIQDLAYEVDNVYVPVQYRAPIAELEQFALALVAELSAAREVVEVTRDFLLPPQVGWHGRTASALDVRERIAAYDKATGEASR
jgi:hypothetical protein